MNITVIGAGYVGLVSGLCFADRGHRVQLVESDKERLNLLQRGKPPYWESDLETLFQKHYAQGLILSERLDPLTPTDLYLISVSTPSLNETIDLEDLKRAGLEVGQGLRKNEKFSLVLIRSTVSPGTTEEIFIPILEKTSGRKFGIDFGVAVNPEFFREGCAVTDFNNCGRIILGTKDPKSLERGKELYRTFPSDWVISTNIRTAELIKLVSNAFFANLISFSNEVARLCSITPESDAVEVLQSIHRDPRLSPFSRDSARILPDILEYLHPGCGFGGSCLPKDLKSLEIYGTKSGITLPLIRAVEKINEEQSFEMVKVLERNFEDLKDLPIAVLGITFKPQTSDIRCSPAIPLLEELENRRAAVRCFDPSLKSGEFRKMFEYSPVRVCEQLQEAIDGVAAVLLVTMWPEFHRLPILLRGRHPQPLIIDGRRYLKKEEFERYEGIGLFSKRRG